YGNLLDIAFFGQDGQLTTVSFVGAARRTFAYDESGNIIKTEFLDPTGNLVKGRLGFARQTITWDNDGGSSETYFGPDGKPTRILGRAVGMKVKWDARGNPTELAPFDEKNQPARNQDGCMKRTFAYDAHGNLTELACFDENDRPIRNTKGWAKVKFT